MARLPIWARLETTGITTRGNLGARLVVKWWAVPFIWIHGMVLYLFGRLKPVPDSCDGLEITETRIEL